MPDDLPSPSTPSWLVRVPLIFSDLAGPLFRSLGVTSNKKLGQDFFLVRLPSPEVLQSPEAALFIPWNVPVQHSWSCDPQKTPGFVEKAAQALRARFGELSPQTIRVGTLHSGPAHQYYRRLASNLRGRLLQVFPALSGPKHDAETQDPAAPTLFCLVGREGLYAGMQSPAASRGFHPGGTKFIKQDKASGAISRAGAKIAEALHHLMLYRPPLPEQSHWLELGASPGGMTSELLARKYRVTAVDRAPLDARLRGAEGLTFAREDVAAFRVREGATFDAILCDLNGDPLESLRHVLRFAAHLRQGGLVIFTLKTPGMQKLEEMVALSREVSRRALAFGLRLVSQTHLSYNRHEFTLFFEQGKVMEE
jgi:23S rRNA (cytidine2498-2'-O)-methyltransferase